MKEDPVSRAIEVLNEALERDPKAITRLVNQRIECNDALAAHASIQAQVVEGVARVGVLGLLNADLGDSPSGVIGAKGTLEGASGRFVVVKRFVDLRDGKLDVLA